MNLENMLKNKKTSPLEYVIMGIIIACIAFIILFNIFAQKSVKVKIQEAESLIKQKNFREALNIYENLNERSFGTSKYDSIIYRRMNELPDSLNTPKNE